MTTTLIVHWVLWGSSLLAAAGAIGALFKLRLTERSLPAWSELKAIDARLPLLREEQRQAGEAAAAQRAALAKLEGEVTPLRQLRAWQDANPDAPTRLQQLVADLEHAHAELTAVQQQLAQEETRRKEIVQDANRLREESAQLTEQVLGLRNQVASLEKQKAKTAMGSARQASSPAKRKPKARPHDNHSGGRKVNTTKH